MPSPAATKNLIHNELINLSLPRTAPVPATVPGRWSWRARPGGVLGIFRFSADTEIFDTGADNANLADGLNIVDLPAGVYLPSFGRFKGSLKSSLALGENASGEIGIGTTVGSGAVATLGGTAAFENWMDGQAIAAITAGATVAQDHSGVSDAGVTESLSAVLSLYLNVAAAFSDEASAHKIVATQGSLVMIQFQYLEVTP